MADINTDTPNREVLAEMGYEDSIVFECPDYDSAIMGVSSNGNVIYSYERWWNT